MRENAESKLLRAFSVGAVLAASSLLMVGCSEFSRGVEEVRFRVEDTAGSDTTGVHDTRLQDTGAADTGIDSGADSTGGLDTADSGVRDTTDTHRTDIADVSDTSFSDTADSSVRDTADTVTRDTADTSVRDTSDTVIRDTADTAPTDTSTQDADTLVPPQVPGQNDLIITEMMVHPTGNEERGEYFEVYNPSGQIPYELSGCLVTDTIQNSFTVSGSMIIQPKEYATFAIYQDPGFTPDYVYPTTYRLANNVSSDGVIIKCNGTTVDEVIYRRNWNFDDPVGVSNGLDPATLSPTANDQVGNWCEQPSPIGNGDLGTPGTMNDPCP